MSLLKRLKTKLFKTREEPERFFPADAMAQDMPLPPLPKPKQGGFVRRNKRPTYDPTAGPQTSGFIKAMPRDLRTLKEKREQDALPEVRTDDN